MLNLKPNPKINNMKNNKEEIFSKEIQIKDSGIIIFPNNIDFLQITRFKHETSQLNSIPKKKASSLLQKPKLTNETPEIKAKKIENEITQIEASILKKEKQLEDLEKSANQLSNKEIEKNEELKELIKKWRLVAQEALIDLHKNLIEFTNESNQKLKLIDLMRMMSISSESIGFNEDNEEFDNE